MKKIVFFIFSIIIYRHSYPQVFQEGVVREVAIKAITHAYNVQVDSAYYYSEKLRQLVPTHPVASMIEGMTILWKHVPIIHDSTFFAMRVKFEQAIVLAKRKDPQLNDPEMIFFTMSAHGLLAEYYAERKSRIKAAGEARKAYLLMKKGSKWVDTHPEFLLTEGLYNYFREAYPEKHPIYKPLLWFFRNGDKKLGIEQLEESIKNVYLTHVQSALYLSYIYLRYENDPLRAQIHLESLSKHYPNNRYIQTKYLESLVTPSGFLESSVPIIRELIEDENPYYRLAGNVFKGYYFEKTKKNEDKAVFHYKKGLSTGNEIMENGEYYKSLGHLGLGRIFLVKGNLMESKKHLNLALHFSETEQISDEAKALLSKI